MEGLGVLLDETVDMAHALLVEDLIDGNEDARLLHLAKTVVDGRSEEFHRRREVHVGVDERRDIEAQVANLAVEDAVVLPEVGAREDLGQLLLGVLVAQRVDGHDEVVLVVEVLLEEIEDHVAADADVARIHGHLAKEVPDVGIDDRQRAETIPKVVEGEDALGVLAHVLVVERDKRSAQLHGVGHVLLEEAVGEVEHVAGGQLGLAVGIEPPVASEEIAVATDDLLRLGVPHDELLVAVVRRVKLVYIYGLARTATCRAERYLAQPAYLPHHVGCVVGCHHIDIVVALVGRAEQLLRSKLAAQHLFADGLDNLFFHFSRV